MVEEFHTSRKAYRKERIRFLKAEKALRNAIYGKIEYWDPDSKVKIVLEKGFGNKKGIDVRLYFAKPPGECSNE